ncbi:Lysine--tRNA ligase [Frankliniella fusca]|uniref:Lysine--tRNA ligase n=1 Tax=Frankliniella fusca TaxID=407009 RepID=A0AAE1LQY4_9NEOP|nr:Lysine--tRNA ligase [Frankliniella fusca]
MLWPTLAPLSPCDRIPLGTALRCAECRWAWSLAAVVLVVAALAAAVPPASAEVASSSSKESKDLLTTNHQLLSGLGLARLPVHGQGVLPSKKVPATEDDSRVFVVRLPPSQHYYSLLKSPPSLANSVSKVEVGFRSNGKPARVYHWNIPVLKKMAAARRRSTQGNGSQPKPAKNPSKSKLGATRRKQAAAAAYHRVQQQQQQQHLLQHHQHQPEPAGPSPYYYVPAKKTSMHKLLGGNGKPHAMYVLEKSRTPAYFQRLLP